MDFLPPKHARLLNRQLSLTSSQKQTGRSSFASASDQRICDF